MDLFHFEQYFSEKALTRAHRYFLKHGVEHAGAGQHTYHIARHDVLIKQSAGTRITWNCTCNEGRYCWHAATVMFTLLGKSVESRPQASTANLTESFAGVLRQITRVGDTRNDPQLLQKAAVRIKRSASESKKIACDLALVVLLSDTDAANGIACQHAIQRLSRDRIRVGEEHLWIEAISYSARQNQIPALRRLITVYATRVKSLHRFEEVKKIIRTLRASSAPWEIDWRDILLEVTGICEKKRRQATQESSIEEVIATAEILFATSKSRKASELLCTCLEDEKFNHSIAFAKYCEVVARTAKDPALELLALQNEILFAPGITTAQWERFTSLCGKSLRSRTNRMIALSRKLPEPMRTEKLVFLAAAVNATEIFKEVFSSVWLRFSFFHEIVLKFRLSGDTVLTTYDRLLRTAADSSRNVALRQRMLGKAAEFYRLSRTQPKIEEC